jgi:DNA-binding NarL/FixJ family response regulator
MSDVAGLDAAFPVALGIALDLVRRPEVAARWTAPSALGGMTVGALAVHLGNQAVRAAALLERTDELPQLASADEHYHRSSWVTAPVDDPVNDRSADEDDAARGPATLAARTDLAVAEVVRLLAEGLSNREIAGRLHLAEGTVKLHLHNAFQKMGARSRADAVRIALQKGIAGA